MYRAADAGTPDPTDPRPAIERSLLSGRVSARASADSTSVRAARNAAYRTAAEIVAKVGTLAYTVVAARVLGQAEFGAYAYALAVGLLVSPVPAWGFNTLLVRHASADLERLPSLLSNVLAWNVIVGVPTFVAVGFLVAPSRPTADAVIVLAVMLAAILVDVVTSTVRAAAEATQRQGGVAVALAVDRTVTAIVAVAVLVVGAGVRGLATAYLIGSLVGLVAAWAAARRAGVRTDVAAVSWSAMRRVVRGSLVMGASAVVAMLLFRVDQIVVEWIEGDAAVAAYAVAYRLVETVLFLSWSATRAVFPAMSQDPTDDRLRRSVSGTVALLAAVYTPFACILVVEGVAVLELLFGAQYAHDAGGALAWLAPAPLLFGLGYVVSHATFARDDAAEVLVANATATVLNLVLNVLLVPILGITGAAITTSVTLGVKGAWLLVRSPVGVGAVLATTVTSVVASGTVVVVLLVARWHVLLELAAAGCVYVAAWSVLTRWREPEYLRLARRLVAR